MANLVGMLVAFPNGLWENIIQTFENGVGSYAVAIILLTLCIKVLLLPIDFINRRSSVKMTKIQTTLAPQITAIQKKYPDKMVQNQKIQELYQKEGFNPMGSCLIMLVVMTISMVVFFTLFSGLNSMAQYKIQVQYNELQRAYVQEYVIDNNITTEDEFATFKISDEDMSAYIQAVAKSENKELINRANENVAKKYEQVKESFLWIKNVWIADSPTAKAIPDFSTYLSIAKLNLEGDARTLAEKDYNAVMSNLQNNHGVNGYFLLAALAGATAFLYQYLLTGKKKKNVASAQPQQSGKAMQIILPIIMVIFTLSYNSVFALYIIVGQLFGMATAPLINWLIKPRKKKEALAVTGAGKVVDIKPDTQEKNSALKSKTKNKHIPKSKSKRKSLYKAKSKQ